jgi:hypothetical protein
MATILYRSASVPSGTTTGSSTALNAPLTNAQIDQNFKNLDAAISSTTSGSAILAALLTVDGTGSGLDADTLDGLNTSSSDTSGNTVVIRSSGNFSAGTITASLSGNATSATSAGKSTNIVGGNNTTLLGSIAYQSNTDTTTLLGPNTTANKRFLTQTGTGTNGAAPVWAAILDADVPNLTGKTYNSLSLTSNSTGFTVSGGTTAVAATFAGGAAYTISGTNTAIYTLPGATATLVSIGGSEALTGKTYNALTLTAAATGFTIAGGTTSKTLTVSNTLTLSGTDASTLNIGTGGTLGSNAFTSTAFQTAQSVTGIVKSSGTTLSAATAGTDYVAPGTATSFTATQTFTGSTSAISSKFINSLEAITVSATAATGTIAYYVTSQSVLYYTTAATANWTVNFRASSGTALDATMANGESITVVFLVTNAASGTAFYNTAVQVDGTAVTPKWQGGTAPTSGNLLSVDAYSYTIVKTATSTFTVFASQVQFK